MLHPTDNVSTALPQVRRAVSRPLLARAATVHIVRSIEPLYPVFQGRSSHPLPSGHIVCPQVSMMMCCTHVLYLGSRLSTE